MNRRHTGKFSLVLLRYPRSRCWEVRRALPRNTPPGYYVPSWRFSNANGMGEAHERTFRRLLQSSRVCKFRSIAWMGAETGCQQRLGARSLGPSEARYTNLCQQKVWYYRLMRTGPSFPDGHGTKIGLSDEDIDENGNIVQDDWP